MKYPVFEIKAYDKIEQLGTKEKFWFYSEKKDNIHLCKFGRPGTGENWTEKITCELAMALDIPCAKYDFAYWFERECVISDSFVPKYGRLIHGNELLVNLINKNYPADQRYKVTEYQISNIEKLLRSLSHVVKLPLGYDPNESIQSAIDMFISYLMFDCLVSNPDRHHENWGIIFDSQKQAYYLAPTYDHASGLGCRVSDEERQKRLSTKDKRFSVSAFVERAKTPIYDNNYKIMTTFDAFGELARKHKKAAIYWLNQLNILDEESLTKIFGQIPNHLISCSASNFAVSIIKENKNRLLQFKEQLTL